MQNLIKSFAKTATLGKFVTLLTYDCAQNFGFNEKLTERVCRACSIVSSRNDFAAEVRTLRDSYRNTPMESEADFWSALPPGLPRKYDQWLRPFARKGLSKELNTLLNVPIKYVGDAGDDRILSDQAALKFIEYEKVKSFPIDNGSAPAVNEILCRWLRDFKVVDLPELSGGSTFETDRSQGLSGKLKYFDVCPLSVLKPFYRDGLSPHEWFPDDTKFVLEYRLMNRFSAVEKSAKEKRGICAEMTVSNFLQGAVQKSLYRYIKEHIPQIPIDDQEPNRRLCQRASIHGEYATIDLSSASDSIGLEQILPLYCGTPLLKYLLALRSEATVFNKGKKNESVLPLNRWASMGNRLTFPVEALTFGAICKLFTDDFLVFGDDIIIPSQYYDQVTEVLGLYGFKVNHDKSYVHGFFRESCGREFFHGNDVTPMYYRPKLHSAESNYNYWVLLANRCYPYFPNTRKAVLETIRLNAWTPFFSYSMESGVMSTHPNRTVLWHSDYQTYYCLVTRPTASSHPLHWTDRHLWYWLIIAENHKDRVEPLKLEQLDRVSLGDMWVECPLSHI